MDHLLLPSPRRGKKPKEHKPRANNRPSSPLLHSPLRSTSLRSRPFRTGGCSPLSLFLAFSSRTVFVERILTNFFRRRWKGFVFLFLRIHRMQCNVGWIAGEILVSRKIGRGFNLSSSRKIEKERGGKKMWNNLGAMIWRFWRGKLEFSRNQEKWRNEGCGILFKSEFLKGFCLKIFV